MVSGRLSDASGVSTDGSQLPCRGAAVHTWAVCPAGIGPAPAGAGAQKAGVSGGGGALARSPGRAPPRSARPPGQTGRAIAAPLRERLPPARARHSPAPWQGRRHRRAPGRRCRRQARAARPRLIRGISPFERGFRARGIPRGALARRLLIGPRPALGHRWDRCGRGQTSATAPNGLRPLIERDSPAPLLPPPGGKEKEACTKIYVSVLRRARPR
jgi:hypothetical protein